jgi:hypothetical protein
MFYAQFAPLEAFAVPALTSMAGFSSAKASLGASILPALSIIISPPFGAVVDIELGKTRTRGCPGPWLQRLWPAGSTQLWAMILPALGIGAIIIHPSLWALGFGLISLGYALSCASLWIIIPECKCFFGLSLTSAVSRQSINTHQSRTKTTKTVVATRSLGLAFGLVHAVDDAGILAVQVAIGRMLDQGKTYRGSILPMLLGFALLAVVATLFLMRLLKRKVEAEAFAAREMEREQALELEMAVGPVPAPVAVHVD